MSYNGDNGQTRYWMSYLPDNLTLNEIVIPGSHDAGMSVCQASWPDDLAAGLSITQIKSILGQLNDGVRYFDLRVDERDDGRLVTYHRNGDGAGCSGENLSDIMNDTRTFLSDYPKETVILKFSHIRGDGHGYRTPEQIKDTLNGFLYQYGDITFKTEHGDVNLATDVSLGEVRGKMILVFDYDKYIDPAVGHFRYYDAATEENPRPVKNNIAGQPGLVVYDVYSDSNDVTEVIRDQVSKWWDYAGFGQPYLFLLSWTRTPQSPWHLSPNPVDGAAELQEQLAPEEEKNCGKGAKRPNIVLIDAVDTPTCRTIISFNPFLQ